jgi:hypothetical protein
VRPYLYIAYIGNKGAQIAAKIGDEVSMFGTQTERRGKGVIKSCRLLTAVAL